MVRRTHIPPRVAFRGRSLSETLDIFAREQGSLVRRDVTSQDEKRHTVCLLLRVYVCVSSVCVCVLEYLERLCGVTIEQQQATGTERERGTTMVDDDRFSEVVLITRRIF